MRNVYCNIFFLTLIETNNVQLRIFLDISMNFNLMLCLEKSSWTTNIISKAFTRYWWSSTAKNTILEVSLACVFCWAINEFIKSSIGVWVMYHEQLIISNSKFDCLTLFYLFGSKLSSPGIFIIWYLWLYTMIMNFN